MKRSDPLTLKLPPVLRHRLSELAAARFPQEACGLLLGLPDKAGAEVLDVVETANLDRERAGDRYLLDPGAFAAADARARSRGHDILGVWHSHPERPAEPSETDRAWAWPDWSYLIVSVGPEGTRELRSWRLIGGRFEEERLSEEQVEAWPV